MYFLFFVTLFHVNFNMLYVFEVIQSLKDGLASGEKIEPFAANEQ